MWDVMRGDARRVGQVLGWSGRVVGGTVLALLKAVGIVCEVVFGVAAVLLLGTK